MFTAMKKNILYSFYIATFMILITGCRPEIPTELAPPGSKLDGINAEWVMVAAQVVDENTLNGDSISITPYYTDAAAPEIEFNSSTFEYTVTPNGKRNFLGSNGTWAFDDSDFPTMIMLTTNEGEPIELMLTSTIRPQDQRLRFNYARECGATAYATYYFEYERK